jgi:hypothetical protein
MLLQQRFKCLQKSYLTLNLRYCELTITRFAKKGNMMGAINGAATNSPFRRTWVHPMFYVVRVDQSLVYVLVYNLLKSIQKWLHNNFLKKYGFGWFIGILLHVAIHLLSCLKLILYIFVSFITSCVYYITSTVCGQMYCHM